MEDISEFIGNDAKSHTFYDSNAHVVDEVDRSCAYIVSQKSKESYYVKFFRGTLFDPSGIDANKINAINTEFKKVTAETFHHYINYLQSKKNNVLRWAERSNIDV